MKSNELIDADIWRVSSRIVSYSDPSIAPLVTTNMTRMSGLSPTNESCNVSIDIRGNASESWSEFNPAMAKRISHSRIPTATNIALTETVDGATVLSVSHSAYGYNIRNELISAAKSVGASSPTNEYACQYDDIGNRTSPLDLGTNRTYTANNLNQYTLISNLCDSASLRETFIPQFDAVKRYGNVYYTELNCIEWEIVYGVRLDSKGNKEEYFEAH